MQMPELLALPLEEAVAKLEAAGYAYSVDLLLPPRQSEDEFAGREIRKYVVRQRKLADNKIALTIVYR